MTDGLAIMLDASTRYLTPYEKKETESNKRLRYRTDPRLMIQYRAREQIGVAVNNVPLVESISDFVLVLPFDLRYYRMNVVLYIMA